MPNSYWLVQELTLLDLGITMAHLCSSNNRSLRHGIIEELQTDKCVAFTFFFWKTFVSFQFFFSTGKAVSNMLVFFVDVFVVHPPPRSPPPTPYHSWDLNLRPGVFFPSESVIYFYFFFKLTFIYLFIYFYLFIYLFIHGKSPVSKY